MVSVAFLKGVKLEDLSVALLAEMKTSLECQKWLKRREPFASFSPPLPPLEPSLQKIGADSEAGV